MHYRTKLRLIMYTAWACLAVSTGLNLMGHTTLVQHLCVCGAVVVGQIIANRIFVK